MVIRSKKGILMETVIFLLLTAVLSVLILLFISRASSGATFYEQIYAKQIALVIDQIKPGTNVTLFVPEMYILAEKNDVALENMINLNMTHNTVKVMLTPGKGYEFSSFRSLDKIVLEINKDKTALGIIAI